VRVLVGVKRVVDAYVKVRVRADGSGVETENVKMSMNPFCEIAVEEAVRMRERGAASEVVAVSCGPETSRETLRTALAVGCDRALLARRDGPLEPLGAARVLRAVVEREEPRLVILGKQSVDSDHGSTAQLLAGMLGWSQICFASSLEVEGDEVAAAREVDAGIERARAPLPAVASADLRLNEPRYASLPSIMKARSKRIEELDADSLGLDLEPRLEVLEVREPPARKAGERVASAEELVERLRGEDAI